MAIISSPDSVGKTPVRFFHFRWAYLILLLFPLSVLLSLLFAGDLVSNQSTALWVPSFVIEIQWPGEIGDTAWMGLHGFLGLHFDIYGFGPTRAQWWSIESVNIVSVGAILLLLAAVFLFVTPKRTNSKNLPATRPIPLCGRLVTAILNGFIVVSMLAGIIETTGYDIESILDQLGWLPAQQPLPSGYQQYWYYPQLSRFLPTTGIWSMASLLSTTIIVSTVAAATLLLGVLWPVTRDRYWQMERRTLIYSLVGVAMVATATIACQTNHGDYIAQTIFLGGWFSVWLLGWWVIVWAWASRTALIFLVVRYDKAITDPENPICYGCGYNLTGSVMANQKKCPECGTAISSRLLTEDIGSSQST